MCGMRSFGTSGVIYDMSSPLEKGRVKGAGWICPAGASFYVADNALLAGIISHI